MKHILLYTLLSTLYTLHLSAAVPLPPWTVDTRRAQPVTFEAYQGETLTFEAHLQANGKPLEAPLNYSFFWQTNGMGNLYWESPCNRTIEQSEQSNNPTNVLFATWLPSMDVGARVYNCFIGSPSNNYHAAFQLRLRPSPGATPNALPLPTPVIDFAKVTVLNPPWGSGGGVDTNAVRDIVRETVSGDARPLPKYLHALDFADSYPEDAARYYEYRRTAAALSGSCSAVRSGNFLYRNFDYPFDDRAEFVVRMAAGPDRFASVGVAQVGTNLTEQFVTSGKPSRWYKALPGATVDGINEHGVVAEINVVDGAPAWGGGVSPALHPLAAVRWALDHATNAQHAAAYLASHIAFPSGWTQNFHYMIADEEKTFIVEDGGYSSYAEPHLTVMTNFKCAFYRGDGPGQERYDLLRGGASITNVWFTRAYQRSTNPPWVSDLAEVIDYTNEIFDAWATHPKEYFRGKTNDGEPWWQTVHTSVYDIPNRVLRICVQENPDWYTFQVPVTGGSGGGGVTIETDPTVPSWAKQPAPPVTPSETAPGVAVAAEYASEAGRANIASDSDHAVIADTAAYAGNAGIAETANMALDIDPDAPGLSGKADKLPYLRVWDEVLQCWWIGRMVNGVTQWEVE